MGKNKWIIAAVALAGLLLCSVVGVGVILVVRTERQTSRQIAKVQTAMAEPSATLAPTQPPPVLPGAIKPTAVPTVTSAWPTAIRRIQPTATQTPAQSTDQILDDELGALYKIDEFQDRGGVILGVGAVWLAPIDVILAESTWMDRSLVERHKEEGAVTMGVMNVGVANHSGYRISIHPAQGTVVVGNEQVDVDLLLSDRVGGEYMPGVIKDGLVYFALERSLPEQITEVRYLVTPPFRTDDWGRLSENDYDFRLILR